MSFFQKLCPVPFHSVSCSFQEPHLGPQCFIYNILVGQTENSLLLGGKYCIKPNASIDSGLYPPGVLQHM